MKLKDILIVICLVVIGILIFQKKKVRVITEYDIKTDTITFRDTIQIPPPPPELITVVDTFFIPVPGSSDSTLNKTIALPVERKEYKTENYFAVIEGYRPELIRLDLFPQTRIITNTEIQRVKYKPRFGVGVHAGYGIGGNKFQPYIGIGIHYNIFSW